MATLGISRGPDYGRLLEENRTLAQDLKQCQADKDFVWSLWKKLQVTNPDLTEAVGLVIQREREKAEIKDRKVLEILQLKDEKIEELQVNLTSRARELEESLSRKVDVQEDLSMLRREVDTLRDRNATLELQMRNVEHREKNLSQVHKQSTEELEAERKALMQKVQFLSTDLEKVRSEKADELALRVQVENKLRVLEREVSQKMAKFEELVKELEEARTLLRRFENQIRQQQQDQDYKNHELETVRKELSELWLTHNQLTEHSSQQADLIRQIQSLQTDTQKMLKNQEDAYCIENASLQQMYHDLTGRYDQAKKMEAELRQQILHLKKDLLDKDDEISDLKSMLNRPRSPYRDNSGSFLQDDKIEPVIDLQYKVDSMQKEMDNLRRQLLEKERKIEDLKEEAINQTIEFDVARLNRHERTHSTPSRPSREFRSIGLSPMKDLGHKSVTLRSRSVSPARHYDLPRHRHQLQKDLDDTKVILKLKVKELNELKKAHSKRLERLKSAQENYKNVKEQLKTLETEYYGTKKRGKRPKRADPKELRHEDSSAVWNELAYFKNENRNLVTERMSLEEEVDSLRVQASQDAATIHEIRLSLEQEREERAYERKKTDRETEDAATKKSEITLLKSEVQNKNIVVERLERDLRDIRSDRDVMLDEKKMLKSEIADLKKEASQHRMDQADLKRDIQRLKRELEEEKAISKLNASKAASPTVKTVIVKPSSRKKRRSKSQNSNYNANKKFDSVQEDDEGWEELSDESEREEEEESELTGTDTLGHHLVDRAKYVRGSHSATSTSDSASVRMRRSIPMKPTSKSRRHIQRLQELPAQYSPAGDSHFTQRVYRDTGTSPAAGPPLQPSPSNAPRRSPVTPAHSAAVRQLKPMKQRVGYLQQQVVTLRDSRAAALKTVEELKETNLQLQSDVNLASQRLKVSKHSIQKLTNDVDKAQQEKTDLEKQLIQKAQASPEPGRTDHDWRVLESRLKSSTNELTRQNAAVRQLKQDNEAANDQIKQLQDKVSRMERDNSQKRTLLEDQRTRVKHALENAKSDAESLEALETRTKLMQDNNEKFKIQVESYKKRLGAVTREKREYEEKFLKLTQEIQKKDKIVLDCQSKKLELESALSEMEKTATQQMKCLARESEDALETAKDKLREIGLTLQCYQRFIKSLAQEVIRRTQQARSSIKEETLRRSGSEKSNASMQRAQDLAKNILNLSQSDLDEIMSAEGESSKMENELETEKRKDKKWMKKVERLQNTKDDFAMALVDLFAEKMEERNELTAKLWAGKTSSQSEIKVDNT